MSVTVESLDKLERRITLTLPADSIQREVESRLKKLSRTVRADGFRPGKVPMSVVASTISSVTRAAASSCAPASQSRRTSAAVSAQPCRE